MLATAIAAACGGSGSGDDGGEHDAAPPSDGNGSSDGNANSDGGVDGMPVSHAPCDSCCDPIAQDCGASMACHPNTNGTATTCVAAGTGQLGAACTTDANCVAGTTCLADNFNGNYARCYKLCVSDSECSAFPSTQHKCQLYTVPQGRTPYGLCFP